jgi:GTP-binding protein
MRILNIKFVKSVLKIENKPITQYPEIAFIGRSNVGKSSMINSLFQRRNLAKTSSTPGKTRLINYFLLDEQIYIVDLPGYGYIKRLDDSSDSWKNLIETYLTQNNNLKIVFLLIDCRHDVMQLDQMMIDWLIYYNIPFIIIMTKRDKLSNNQFNKRLAKINNLVPKVTVIPFSAKSYLGRDTVLDIIQQIGDKDESTEIMNI